jgi:hypothetical protein
LRIELIGSTTSMLRVPTFAFCGAGKTSQRTVERVAIRSKALHAAPALNEGIADGSVSAEHTDALAAVTARLDDGVRDEWLDPEDELAETTSRTTPEQFRRHLGDITRMLSNDDGVDRPEQQRHKARLTLAVINQSGMGQIRGELHPSDYQKVNRRVDAEVRALRRSPEHASNR